MATFIIELMSTMDGGYVATSTENTYWWGATTTHVKDTEWTSQTYIILNYPLEAS